MAPARKFRAVTRTLPTMAAAKAALSKARRGKAKARRERMKIHPVSGGFEVVELAAAKNPVTTRPQKKSGKSRRGKRGGRVVVRGKVKHATFVLGKGRGRRNPDFDDSEEGAAEMFERFTGRESDSVTEYEFEKAERLNVAKCGTLRYLKVMTDDGDAFTLSPRGVIVTTTPEGGQLYFVAGDQALDLDGLGLASTLPKDLVSVGQCFEIMYHTSKDFHDFEPTDYYHHFGARSGILPRLGYDVLNEMFYLEGGSYQVKREGIVD